ncbi:NAD(P)H-dependent amine dehydrogenase family protein [Mycolicibacterium elephantis]|uniref:Dihydrodipicolinate reductase n=1 Tax=Mycolicibacterium elephantis TaxID=81858 RepID=A0A0M2ZLX3_9MYCO|nr:dihydrodipicolinate reductase [Mycolicibacterium elephantis]KKW66521.1 dihydrodipicolinate reductase [Mycolicibacterium elephantis]OBB19898.1 dihydrodipicolinate reductase [Mycolicibacterium elephantis]OBE97393.1 dihydrodipicolinate reductase [Mycolicibacterium elephantis]ORA67481.1 dihydrodipicolinate reductase [Mycolicibacterium elephantis]
MPEKTYRVIQWMTGDVGQVGVRHIAQCPVFDLVGVLVHNKDKVGKDAGEIAGIPPVGVTATDDVESIIAALDADCVFYTPVIMDVDTVCRLLRSGKNVVTTSGFFHPTERFRDGGDKIRAACEEGGTSFHAGGIHPGYAGDILPLTLARVTSRIDKIQLWEVVNVLTDAPMDHIDWMGFGKDKDKFLSEPTILGLGIPFFAQSMQMVADGIGVRIDDVTAADVKAAVATEDIPHAEGAIPRGTVAAQHHEWTAWVDGDPLIVYHAIYLTGGPDQLDPAWDWGRTRYRIAIEGDPSTELTMHGLVTADGTMTHPGYDWTAMGAINAIPDVCDAPPGWLTHLDLGLVQPRGLVRK